MEAAATENAKACIKMSVVIELIKFGDYLVSRPAGREAALSALAYDDAVRELLKRGSSERICELNARGVVLLAPS